MAVSVKGDAHFRSFSSKLLNFILCDSLVDHNECIHMSCKVLLFHCEDLRRILLCDKQCLHLSLIEDVVDLLNRHSFKETNCSDLVVHATQERLSPLWSILHPDSKEAPHLTFAFDLVTQVKSHEAAGEVYTELVNFSKCLPHVLAEAWLAIHIIKPAALA